MKKGHLYIVSYDICSPNRWRKVFRELKRIGQRQQLSVFRVICTQSRMKRLEQKLMNIIDPDTDKLLVISLGSADIAEKRLSGTQRDSLLLEAIII